MKKIMITEFDRGQFEDDIIQGSRIGTDRSERLARLEELVGKIYDALSGIIDPDALVSPRQAARLRQCDVSTIYRKEQAGELKAVEGVTPKRYRRRDVLAL